MVALKLVLALIFVTLLVALVPAMVLLSDAGGDKTSTVANFSVLGTGGLPRWKCGALDHVTEGATVAALDVSNGVHI